MARQTERREFRKEVRDRVGDLQEASASVEAAALAYWVSSTVANAPAAAIALTAAIKRLSRLAILLKSAGLVFDQPNLLAEVRKAATSGDFGKKARRHSAIDATVLADTVGALEDLLLAVDEAFYAQFRPIQPSPAWRWGAVLIVLLLLQG